MTVHYLTLTELRRIAHTTPGNEALAELLEQVVQGSVTIRVDLDKLLRKPDETKGSLPPL
jgi:hypothetical protein